jgi:hypothetical protein
MLDIGSNNNRDPKLQTYDSSRGGGVRIDLRAGLKHIPMVYIKM